MDEESTTLQSTNATFGFSSKSLLDHIRELVRKPAAMVGTFAAVFGGFWTIYEASISSLSLTPNRFWPYLAFLMISTIAAISVRVYQYMNEIPEGLENINKSARRIAQLQRPKWEFKFAKSVLAEQLGPIDRECRDLINGNVFVRATRPKTLHDYMRQMIDQPTNMMHLLKIVNRVIITEFPKSLTSTDENPACPKNIVDTIETISRLYRETVELERFTQSVMPPEHFERVHSLQIGWSEPIRDGIHELFEILQQICDVDHRVDSSLQFAIEFDEPPNLHEFMEEMDRLQSLIPSLMENEAEYGE